MKNTDGELDDKHIAKLAHEVASLQSHKTMLSHSMQCIEDVDGPMSCQSGGPALALAPPSLRPCPYLVLPAPAWQIEFWTFGKKG